MPQNGSNKESSHRGQTFAEVGDTEVLGELVGLRGGELVPSERPGDAGAAPSEGDG